MGVRRLVGPVVVALAVGLVPTVGGLAGAGGATGWTPVAHHQPVVPTGVLHGMACSGGACVAVGSAAHGTFAAGRVGARGVRAAPPPVPGAVSSALFGVACVSASDCVAVGMWGGSTYSKGGTLIEHWNGTAWHI